MRYSSFPVYILRSPEIIMTIIYPAMMKQSAEQKNRKSKVYCTLSENQCTNPVLYYFTSYLLFPHFFLVLNTASPASVSTDISSLIL